MGGQDSGPSPLEYLLGSLAGCEDVIAQLVAREKGIKLNSIRFEVEGTLDVKGLLGDPAVKPYFQTVRVRATVDSPEDESRIKGITRGCGSTVPGVDYHQRLVKYVKEGYSPLIL